MVFPVMYLNEVSPDQEKKYALLAQTWDTSIMMSTVVVVCHLSYEKRKKVAFLKQ